MNRLKVLACAYTCSPTGEGERFGGGEDILGWNMVKQLSRFHSVRVLAHTRNKPSIEADLNLNPDSNLNFHYFALPRWLSILQEIQGGIQLYAFLWQLWALIEAWRLHREHKFQVFHHITYANDWMASYIGALLPIHYIRGPGGGAHRTPKPYLKLYGVKGRLWELIRVIGQTLFRYDPFFVTGQKRAKALLVCNQEAYEAVPHKWRNKTHLFAVCGISRDDLERPLADHRSGNTFRVISAGKLLRIKGFDLAIQAFSIFREEYPNSLFTIVGDGPELSKLQRLVKILDAQDFVEFIPWRPRSLLLDMMAQSDVFLFPSLRDGGGAVVVESMAMGTPVICLDISGPGMHVTNASGIKIAATSPETSVQEMAVALRLLNSDHNMLNQMAYESRDRANRIYHWDRVGERLLEIYLDMFQESPESGC